MQKRRTREALPTKRSEQKVIAKVVAATSNIVDLSHEPSYTRESGVALGVAANCSQNINLVDALQFVDTRGTLRGYRIGFQATNRLCEERLKSANEVMTRLGKNRA